MNASPSSVYTSWWRQPWLLNTGVTVGSVLICLMLLPSRIPGMEILGVGPHWLLIWVVTWSVKRTMWQGAIAGLVLGLLQDAMTSPHPTHVFSLVVVGVLTARLQKQRYLQEDIVSVALLLSADSLYPALSKIWLYHQRIALSSAILSSLWAPAIYYPLNRWWDYQGTDS